MSKGVNIRIDATVTESRGDQVLGRKVVSVTLVDGESARCARQHWSPGIEDRTSFTRVPLNMDAEAACGTTTACIARVTLD